jgi:hypothetical protein
MRPPRAELDAVWGTWWRDPADGEWKIMKPANKPPTKPPAKQIELPMADACQHNILVRAVVAGSTFYHCNSCGVDFSFPLPLEIHVLYGRPKDQCENL